MTDPTSSAVSASPNHGHIVRSFDDELDALSSEIVRMGGYVEAQLKACMNAVVSQTPEDRKDIRAREREVNSLQEEVDQRALRLFALRQPMARDLRYTVGAMKMASELERIGDLAKVIGYRAEDLSEYARFDITPRLERLGQLVLSQVNEALDAFGSGDVDQARRVWDGDDAVDTLYNDLVREVLVAMAEETGVVDPGAHILFVLKNLERIGDHATNIAETIHFIELGRPLEVSD